MFTPCRVFLFLVALLCCQVTLVQGRVFSPLRSPPAAKTLPSIIKHNTVSSQTPSTGKSSSIFHRTQMSVRNKIPLSRKQLVVPIAGTIAASIAELATYPLDMAKVNMQVSRGKRTGDIGIFDLLSSVVAINGILGLWRGFSAALLRQIAYQVLKVMLFEPLTALIVFFAGAKSPAVHHMLLGGGLAGTLGAFLTTPFDGVKVRSQILGNQAKFSTSEGLREIFQAFRRPSLSSIAPLYTGAGATSQRAFMLNAAELTAYKVVKTALIKGNSSLLRYNNSMDNTYTHLLSALCSGFVASAVSAPIDRAKTLIIASPDTYSGIADCLSDVFVKQGLVGLYKGFFATWLRLAPFTVLFFISFEYFKSLL